jgi:hypothetical protein
MKLFICWAGERSKEIASFLHEWLKKVHQNIDQFMSEVDIGKGERWIKVLADQLENSEFGLVCLTSENLTAPWLYFEAGALSKITGSHVVPIIYKLETGDKGPIGDFQAAALDNRGQMQSVLEKVNDVMGSQGNKNWRGTFDDLWGKVEEKIKSLDELDKIQITCPKEGGVLANPIKHQRNGAFTYLVRGTLKYLQTGHQIWLLNAGRDGQQWPQERITTYNSASGTWDGRVYLQTRYDGTFINAVVAPPTSQQLFEYYKFHGSLGNWRPLSQVPHECKNVARVWASNPNYTPS